MLKCATRFLQTKIACAVRKTGVCRRCSFTCFTVGENIWAVTKRVLTWFSEMMRDDELGLFRTQDILGGKRSNKAYARADDMQPSEKQKDQPATPIRRTRYVALDSMLRGFDLVHRYSG